MRLLVFEFITGGGLLGDSLPDSLQREGEMMRDALLADLLEFPEIDVVAMRDPRCAVSHRHRAAVWCAPVDAENTMTFYRRVLADVDVVWLIAPETGGALEQLARTARAAGKQLLLSDAATLALCSSKYETHCALRRAGIHSIATFRATDELPAVGGPWLVKPDDGAGSMGIQLLANIHEARQALCANRQWPEATRYPRVLQPWCDGDALSLSLLCSNGRALLLSVNRQHVFLQNGRISVDALTVNAVPRDSSDFVAVGQQVADALPGLWGYIGVDLIRTDDGILKVLEINPRLTTSYCGLRYALGINIADLVLRQFHHRALPNVVGNRNEAVELDLAMDYA